MQRLLADAQKLTGVKYDLNNLSDVYEAIHVIQTDLGITGTTALEASSTFSGSFASMKSALSNFMGNLTLGEDIKPALESLISTTGTFLFNNLFPMVGNIVSGLAGYIADVAMNTDWISVIQNVLGVVRDVLSNGLTTYFGVDSGMIDKAFGFLIEGVPIVAENMQIAFGALCDGLKVIWDSIGQPIWDAIAFAITEVQGIFAQYMPAIMMFVQTAITGIKDSWENHLKPCFEAIGGFLNTVLVPLFQFVFDAIIRPLIQNTFEYIRNLWNDTLKPVFDNICDFLTNVFTGNWSEAFQNILNIVTAIFDGICNKISSKMEFAKDVINNAIEKIKGFFNFEWSLPKLKMPHPKISGSFSLNPPSVPSFSIDWYAKAMNEPMIMNSPTAFGINSLGQIMAGGEKGSEVVSGTETLMNMIASAVASQNKSVIDGLYTLRDVLLLYLPQIANMQVVTETGTLIGVLEPGLDKGFGRELSHRNRRN